MINTQERNTKICGEIAVANASKLSYVPTTVWKKIGRASLAKAQDTCNLATRLLQERLREVK